MIVLNVSYKCKPGMRDEFLEKIMAEDVRNNIYLKFRSFGFSYVTLDLLGYRTGSMNEMGV